MTNEIRSGSAGTKGTDNMNFYELIEKDIYLCNDACHCKKKTPGNSRSNRSHVDRKCESIILPKGLAGN